jgi:hypothetical protein
MKVTPKTEEDLAKEGLGARELLRDGVYDFEVAEATEETSSKTGADMIKLKLTVFDSKGFPRTVFDYLMEGAMAYKMLHFAESTGLTRQYNSGELSAFDCENKTGRLKIGKEPARGEYRAKNNVVDYEPPATRPLAAKPAAAPAARAKAPVDDIDDQIPF